MTGKISEPFIYVTPVGGGGGGSTGEKKKFWNNGGGWGDTGNTKKLFVDVYHSVCLPLSDKEIQNGDLITVNNIFNLRQEVPNGTTQ
jgi:hypothetical protein